MMTKLRLVLDTNVLIGGLLIQNSIPQQIYDHAIAQAILITALNPRRVLGSAALHPIYMVYLLDDLLQQVNQGFF